ncbi:S8 family serine peptidase [Streptomyces sp. NBC_00316]|uniref:S8 family serine peptidase n=1 Tax=Streptomyces sp. NBC_00316 TaxID=2975710 RepID=UPI002E2AD6D9|nr:S8 family serine peptidase [Streptomyces sp. NBC_00316]
MRPHIAARKGLPLLAAVTALLTVIPSAAADDGGPAAPGVVVVPGAGSADAAVRTVTLITGDRVTVTPGGSGPVTVAVAGPDGGRANARVTTRDGDVYVFPAAVERHIAAGQLDEALFDVTRLVADGYDDSRSRGLPVILSYASDSLRRKDLPSLPDGATGARALTSVNGTAVTENRDEAADFWADLTRPAAKSRAAAALPELNGGVTKVWLDSKVSADLADSVAQIGAPKEWARGNTGSGVDVAVLDTGYDTGHPDLDGVVASSRSFVPDEEVVDRNGHGTHVASTIAGNGAASDGAEKGVAPGARLHVGKVLGNNGSGSTSWIIEGMEWAARDAHARVISMSLGGYSPSDGTDPLSQAVNTLSAESGALFTVAAGNAGPDESTVSAPGAADAALTVGAVDSSDAMASFSGRGPRFRDDALKPEITAPGVGILAARSQYATFGSGSYALLNGTSMATPHVAGAAALVAARHPDWTGQRIKDALVSTAHPTPGTPADTGGNGRVDVAAAAAANLVSTGVADSGIHSLGGKPGETVTRGIEWLNSGNQAITVTVRTDAPDAPAGLFTVADHQVTVPAHGSAATTVTTDLDRAPAGSRFTGHVTALVDGHEVTRTLLAVSTREEMHHLRVHVQGRDGEPLSDIVRFQRKGDVYPALGASDVDGDIDMVVPDGTYTVWMWGTVRGTHGASSLGRALLVKTGIQISGTDKAVTLDGTRLRETEFITPQEATAVDIRTDLSQSFKDGSPAITDSESVGLAFDSMWTLPTAKPTGGDLLYTVRSRMEQPLLSLSSGPQKFDDLWLQPWSARPTERARTLPAVFAGAGTANAYEAAGARGKIAVVRYAGEDQAAAAEKAGVAMLVLVNDVDGRLFEAGNRTSLVTAGISRTEGESLIDRIQDSSSHSVPMRTVGHAETGYLYDLVHTWRGGIPETARYAPRPHELAKVDVEFRNSPAHDVMENRFDVQSYLPFRFNSQRLSTAGARRTDWVTASPDATWTEEAYEETVTSQYSGQVSYPAGRTTDVTWFGPIEHPRLNESQQPPRRTGNSVSGLLAGFGDGGRDHAATSGPGTTTQTVELHRGGTLLSSAEGAWLDAELPAVTSRYRLVTTTERTGGHPYSVATRTEWSFSSTARPQGEQQVLPLVQLDYALATSADGAARRDAELVVTASQLKGVPTAKTRTDEVELSYDDGRTWQRATLSDAGDGSARAKLDAPRRAAFLSVRVHASDSRGDTVTQTVIRAAGLR